MSYRISVPNAFVIYYNYQLKLCSNETIYISQANENVMLILNLSGDMKYKTYNRTGK